MSQCLRHPLPNPLQSISNSTPHPKQLRLGFFSPIRKSSPLFRMKCSNAIGVVCEKSDSMDDGFYMRRCVELARKAIGCTSPNPMVGCVIVKDGEIVGEGFHPKAGQPHAEVFALKDAGSVAENATAYVSLEPCNHYGRTPPCTEALIAAKVKRVVVGMVDPNPIVASKGVEKLRASGIDVVVGVEEMLCQKLIEAYTHRMLTGKPFVTLRYSLSFNGSILSELGEGAEEPGGYYSQMLHEYDGIVTSSDLFTKTSTLPTSRETGTKQPLQIIIARGVSSLCLPHTITESSTRIIILAENPITLEPEMEGVEVVVLEQLNLTSVLDYCGTQGLCSLILDFRGNYGDLIDLIKDGLDQNLVQKVVTEMCPTFGGNEGTSTVPFGRESLKLKDLKARVLNESVIVEGYISRT